METVLNCFVGCLCLSTFLSIAWTKLNSSSVKFSIIKYIQVNILIAICLTISNLLLPTYIKLLVNVVILVLINYVFYNRKIKKAITSTIITEFIIVISELIFGLFYSLIFKNELNIIYTTYNGILINFIIAVISFLLFEFVRTLNSFNKLLEYSIKEKNKWIIIYSIALLILAIFSTFAIYLQWNPIYVLLINMMVICAYISTIIKFIINQEQLREINSKYETSISSLKEYEVMIDKFRVDTHENKNEFLTIRNMLKDKNNKETVIKYIDKLVDNKIKDNDKIMKKTSKIPEGGLRATIYSKLCLMDKLKINYKLNISREVRTTDLINLDEDLVLKRRKILGVFIDNAIEAVKELKKKERSIEIYIMDDELCIDITNNFEGSIDLDKINNLKYTTKGNGHGYGLTLVSKLIAEESDKLENEKSINRDNFTQTLKIKM